MPIESDVRQRLEELLLRTSRTFALSIPVLPEPLRREVTAAYLLFRIADTLEDATAWEPRRQARELSAFGELLLGRPGPGADAIARGWVDDPPLAQPDYVELLGESTLVLRELDSMPPRAAAIVREHTLRTVELMKGYVLRPRPLQLRALEELKDYCYAVAGVVGEMLTELFIESEPMLRPHADGLRERSASFGEALQLVNILKDAGDDACEGRRYLPEGVPIAAVFALARADLRLAGEYVRLLQSAGARRGIVEFNALPVMLAWSSLDRIERDGPGSKLTRDEVLDAVTSLAESIEAGRRLFADRAAGG